MKGYALLLCLFASFSGYAQNTINNYKYVVVPEKFNFSKEENQYGLNTVTKSLLEEKGFTVYFESDIPKELAGNRCNALTTDVAQKKGLFVTNLTVILKDCQGNILFKSKEGKSREKEFATSYNLALRDAFTSLNDVPYAYNGTVNAAPQQAAVAAPVAAATVAATAAPTPSLPATTPVAPETKEAAGTLYAQPTANGYQLIDTAPKIVLTLLKTSAPDYFIADNGTAHGIVMKKNGEWHFEYYKDSKLIAEKLLIKF
ncbi:hypothetical protein [Chitinophaga sp.]|uniref:hypothetical protein n=1 Tax=Chitinophaga sp. TaxID=1869181 RepID=UPI002F939000